MAVETWGVTAAIASQHMGTHAPALTAETTATITAHIVDAAGLVNLRIRQWTGADPAAVAAGSTAAALDVAAAVAKYIKDSVASAWLQPRNRDAAEDYESKAREGLSNMRYSIPEARAALAPEVGPPRTDGQTTAPRSWLDVANPKDVFG